MNPSGKIRERISEVVWTKGNDLETLMVYRGCFHQTQVGNIALYQDYSKVE